MPRLTSFTLKLMEDKIVYHPGDKVKGYCRLILSKPVTVTDLEMTFRAVAQTHWTETITYTTTNGQGQTQTHTQVVHHGAKHIYFDLRQDLSRTENGRFKHEIPAGHFEFYFEFHLPSSGIPNSFEGGENGNIRYILKAEIRRSVLRTNYRTSLAINVIVPYRVIQHPDLMLPVSGTVEKHVCCFRCKSGPLSVSAYIERQGNSPGGQLIFTAQFENLTTRKVRPTLTLHQLTTFFAKKRSVSTSCMYTLHSGNVIGPKESSDWDRLGLEVPSIYSTFTDSALIQNVYFLRLTIEISGTRSLTMDFNIVIGMIELPAERAGGGTANLDSAPPSYQFLYPAAPTMADLDQEDRPPSYDRATKDEK